MLDQEKIGKFVADRRKNKSMTQKQLAEQLGVSDKAVSKWETGRSMPDNSILMDLCEILEINVNELLSGEKLSDDNYHGRAEENIVRLMEQSESDRKREKNALAVGVFGTVALGVALAGIICMVSGDFVWYLDIPSLMVILPITVIVLLTSGLLKDFFVGFAICLRVHKQVDEVNLRRAVAANKLVMIVVPVTGIITFLVTVISIIGNVDNKESIGPNLAVSFLTVLYSLIFDLMLLPVSGRLWAMSSKKHKEADKI